MKKLLFLIAVVFFICCSFGCGSKTTPSTTPTTTPEEVETIMDEAENTINNNP